jgi:hypothetical protein
MKGLRRRVRRGGLTCVVGNTVTFQNNPVASNGLVSLRTSSGIQVRKDAARKFEKMLLSLASQGLLPEGLIE